MSYGWRLLAVGLSVVTAGCTFDSDPRDSSSASSSTARTTIASTSTTVSSAEAMRALGRVLADDALCSGPDCTTAAGWLSRADEIAAVLASLGIPEGKSPFGVAVDSFRNAHQQLRSCIQLSDEKAGSEPDRDCRGPISLVERAVAELREASG